MLSIPSMTSFLMADKLLDGVHPIQYRHRKRRPDFMDIKQSDQYFLTFMVDDFFLVVRSEETSPSSLIEVFGFHHVHR